MSNSDIKMKEKLDKLIEELEKEIEVLKTENKILQETQKPKIAEIKARAKVLLAA